MSHVKGYAPHYAPASFGHTLYLDRSAGQAVSWWVGLSREAFAQQVRERAGAMQASRGASWVHSVTLEDLGSSRARGPVT